MLANFLHCPFASLARTGSLNLKRVAQKMSSARACAGQLIPLSTEEKQSMQRNIASFFVDLTHIDSFRSKSANNLYAKQPQQPQLHWVQLNIPYTTNSTLQSVMSSHDDEIRVGRLLEFLEVFAGYIGEQGRGSLPDAVFDHIELFGRLSTKRDVALKGYIVDASFKQVRIDVFQRLSEDEDETLLASAIFELSSERNTFGRLSSESKISTKPTADESEMIHTILTDQNIRKGRTPIELTRISDTHLMQMEDQGEEKSVFRGFLMRKLLESGWLCGYMHGKGAQNPAILYVGSAEFDAQIQVGETVRFTSHIASTSNKHMDVYIEALIINPTNRDLDRKAASMHLILETSEIVAPVYPDNYEHGMLFIESHKILSNFLSHI